jgi:hypothetical protein
MPSTRKSTTATASKAKAITKPKGRKGAARPKPTMPAVPADNPSAVPSTGGTGAPADSKPLSGLDAAAIVLRDASAPLNTQDLVRQMLERGLWKTEGKTPAATIYAAMIREIRVKGSASRFRKADRGRFSAAG